MTGAQRGHRQRLMATAWHVENFSRVGKKLRDLTHYLDESGAAPSASRRTSGAAIVGFFKNMQARGAPVTISQREG